MWPWRRPLGLNARDFNFGGHEVGRILHLEVHLAVGAIHGRGLLHPKVGLQREACSREEEAVDVINNLNLAVNGAALMS